MRAFLLLAALPFLATFAPESLSKPPPRPDRALIWSEPVPLEEGNPGRTRIGRLALLEGWALRSNHPKFGGLSAMHVENGEVTAISDGGILFRFAIPAGRRPMTFRMTWLHEAPGDNKKARDSEAMAVAGGRAWIAYERANQVWRYERAKWRSDAHASPEALDGWPENSGSEAMVRLPDGRFLIFSEGQRRRDGSTEALLFSGDPTLPGTRAVRFGYRAPEKYRITDAALLPDGKLLLLNRRISMLDGISAKLLVADLADVREGAVLTGTEIAHSEPPVTTDNYEALSVAEEGGRTIVWIASDDNFMGFQRTLLMKFALAEN